MPQPETWANDSLEPIRQQLVRRGLPLDYAERSVAELADHHQDLVDELRRGGAAPAEARRQADARLGEPRKLAKKIVRGYQCRSAFGRWPLVSFVLAPLPLLLACWVATVCLLYAVCSGCEWVWAAIGWGRASTLLQTVLMESFLAGMLIVVPAAVAYFWTRVALGATRNRAYAAIVCLLIALSVGTLWSSYTVGDAPRGGTLALYTPAFIPFYESIAGLPFGEPVLLRFGVRQVFQLLAPLAVGGWLIYRETRSRRRALRAAPPLDDGMRVAA